MLDINVVEFDFIIFLVLVIFNFLYPEWAHRHCVGLAFRRSHVRISVSAVSLLICSPH